jgi:DNA-binding response OmpR family regulator
MGKTINVRNLETPNLPILGDTQLLVTEPKILVVDDEKQILDLLADFLGRAGYQVTIANNAQTALHALTQETFSLVLSDLKMPEMNGLEMLVKIKEIDPNIVTIIMTGYGTLESAVAAMKHGAFDYVLKPFKVDQVISLIQRGLENRRLKEENLRLKEIVSLYNMSEAISQSLHAELIHEITLDTIYSAIETDFVNLLLRDQSTTPLYEVGNRTAISVSGDFLFQESFIGKLLSMHAEKTPVNPKPVLFFSVFHKERNRKRAILSAHAPKRNAVRTFPAKIRAEIDSAGNGAGRRIRKGFYENPF